jgi:hypothetical protein
MLPARQRFLVAVGLARARIHVFVASARQDIDDQDNAWA